MVCPAMKGYLKCKDYRPEDKHSARCLFYEPFIFAKLIDKCPVYTVRMQKFAEKMTPEEIEYGYQ